MNWLIMALLLFVNVLLQGVLPGYAVLAQARWPFLLATVLYYALNREKGYGLAAGLFAGILQDALSPVPLGYSAFCFCVVAWIAGRFRRVVLAESVITPAFFGALSAILSVIGLYVLLIKDDLVRVPFGRVVIRALGTGLLAVVVTPLMFALARRLDRLVGNVVESRVVDEVELPI